MGDIKIYFFTFMIFTTFIWAFFKFTRAKSHLPPTPFALPIIGHLHLLAPIPHQAFYKLSLRYGPIYRVFLGSTPCIVASSPETAKEFLRTHESAYLDRSQNSNADNHMNYGSNGFIFAPYGPYWKFMKKVLMSQLLNGTTLDSLSLVGRDEINRFMKSLSENAKVGKAVDLGGELMKLMNNVISRMLIGKRCLNKEGEADDVGKMVVDITQMTGNFNISDYVWLLKTLDLQGFGKRVKDIESRYDAMMERIMQEHEEARKHKETEEVTDLLNILLDIAEDESTEIKLTRLNIKAFIMNVFTAGSDTSASTIEWGLAELINHPNILGKVVEEIDQVVGKNIIIQESDIPNLPYLQAIVKETLRLHPTVPVIQRASTQDCVIAGYHIPAKINIFVNLWAIGRDPDYWENPLEFRPERFIESQVDIRGQHFQMLPFGSGRRMCPGISLALRMIQTTLGAMIQCFDWNVEKDGNLPSLDMEEGFGLTLPRANTLVCVPVARLDPIPFSI